MAGSGGLVGPPVGPAGAHNVGALLREWGVDRIIALTELEKKRAVLLRLLCGNDVTVMRWVHGEVMKKYRWRPGLAVHITKAVLDHWAATYAPDALIARAIADPRCDMRAEAHLYLAEVILAKWVKETAGRGLLVPSGAITAKYVFLLGALPAATRITNRLAMLQRRGQGAKKWSRRFRDDWQLTWGSSAMPHQLNDASARQRARVWFRWVRHHLEVRRAGRPCIIVNMDETMLSNVKCAAKGVKRPRDDSRAAIAPKRDRGLPRTSLMAAVCSDDELQNVLPQVRLPRVVAGRRASEPLRAAYAAGGLPLFTVYGSSGWVTSSVMAWYVSKLARAIRQRRPGHQVVLMLDCCPCHLSLETLAACQRNDVDVLMVPARMTWALQPLDTHVFSVLKREVRRQEFDAKALLERATLTPLQRIEVHGEVIRKVLVDRPWASVVRRVGLTGEAAMARPALRNLLGDEPAEATQPSVAELADLLQLPAGRAGAVAKLLLEPRRPPRPSARPAPRPVRAIARSSAGAVPASASPAPRPWLRLSRMARLPRARPASPSRARAYVLGTTTTRPVTRSMSASSGLELVARA